MHGVAIYLCSYCEYPASIYIVRTRKLSAGNKGSPVVYGHLCKQEAFFNNEIKSIVSTV